MSDAAFSLTPRDKLIETLDDMVRRFAPDYDSLYDKRYLENVADAVIEIAVAAGGR